jgi:preprotein translocase subunit SecG
LVQTASAPEEIRARCRLLTPMIIILFTLVHVVVCLFLIIVVLLQSGKAADLAGAFGGMGSQTAFGPRGSATLLSKSTTISAALFMVTSLSLSILHTRGGGSSTGGSVLEKTPAAQTELNKQKQQPPAPTGLTPGTPMQIEMGKPGDPVAPGQPSVTFETETGAKVGTAPLKFTPVDPKKAGQAKGGQPAPSTPPAKK